MINSSWEEFLAFMFCIILEENTLGILGNERIVPNYCSWSSLCSHMPNMMVFLCVVFLFLCDTVLNIRLSPKFADMLLISVCRTLVIERSYRES